MGDEPHAEQPVTHDPLARLREADSSEVPFDELLALDRLRNRLFGAPPAPARLGRYVLLGCIGRGGMGTVYRAHDPELDREVAIKLVASQDDGTAAAQARLLREAEALARLSHPNVVQVFDVGTYDRERIAGANALGLRTRFGVFLVMELVVGDSLSRWLETPRPWREVLDTFFAAGEGLAAAHAAGIVHGDFKPTNVLVARGRVIVVDFGLARPVDPPAAAAERTGSDTGGSRLAGRLASALTDAEQMGTPAYMAPEQHAGDAPEPRSDQFAYCVALHEALHGARPFEGSTWRELAQAKERGELRSASDRTHRIPRGVRRVVLRGLTADLDSRWPTMDALLGALRRERAPRRWGRRAAALGLAGLCAIGWRSLDRSRRIKACEAAGASITEVWNEDTRAALGASLLAADASYAQDTAERVMPWLDEHARAWRAARTEACLDAQIRGTWDAEHLERSSWCLEEHRMELEALVAALTRTDGILERAVPAAAALGPIEPCRDEHFLARLPSPPPAEREEVRAIRAELSTAAALQHTGAYDDALVALETANARAQALGWQPLVLDARLRLGELLEQAGDYARAEETLEAAFFTAKEAGAAREAFRAAQGLVLTVGYRLGRHEEALQWSRHAEALLPATSDPGRIREAKHLSGLGSVHWSRGAHAQARALYERALAIEERTLGPMHPRVAATLNNLGNTHWAAGAYEEASPLYERSLAIKEQSFGPTHPEVGSGSYNLALLHYRMGSYEEARRLNARALAIWEKSLGFEHPHVARSLNLMGNIHLATQELAQAAAMHERALAVREKALGSDHVDLAESLSNLANVHHKRGAHLEAETLHARALAIREAALGAEHPDVAQSLNNLANVHRANGAHDEARALYERALASWERALGPEHPHVAAAAHNLAVVHHASGAHEEAWRLHHRALAIWERIGGGDHPDVARALVALAEVALARQRPHDAVTFAQRALRSREAGLASKESIAEAGFALARGLWTLEPNDARAVALAESARDAYRAAGEAKAMELARVEAWLEHRD